MKQVSFTALIALILSSFLFTGYQCGSAEETSAKLYMSRNDWQNAEMVLLKEVQNNPLNAEAWYNLGFTRIKKGDIAAEVGNYDTMHTYFTLAVEAYKKANENSKEYETKINSDELFAWQKSLNAGVTLYNKSISASKDSASMLRKKAILAYETSITIRPDSLLGYKNAAVALHADGNTDEEIKYLIKAREKKSDSEVSAQIIQYYLDKAEAASNNKDAATANKNYDMALAELAAARKTDPENSTLLDAMVNIYIKLGKANEAIPLMQEALSKDPNNKLYHYNLGVLQMQANDYPKAIEHFEATLKADPNYDAALQNIAATYMKRGDERKKAAMAAAEAKKKDVDKSYLEDFKKAAEYLEKLIGIKPDNAELWDYLGSAYANAGDLKKAQEALKKADSLRK